MIFQQINFLCRFCCFFKSKISKHTNVKFDTYTNGTEAYFNRYELFTKVNESVFELLCENLKITPFLSIKIHNMEMINLKFIIIERELMST